MPGPCLGDCLAIARSSRERLHGRPFRTASAPWRRNAVTSLPKARGLSPVNGGIQDGRRDHTRHAKIILGRLGASFEPADWRRMMEQNEALQLAVAFLAQSQRDDEPPLAIDTERVRESDGLLIVPYNSVQFLASRDVRQQLLDCWPTVPRSVRRGLYAGQVPRRARQPDLERSALRPRCPERRQSVRRVR